MATWRFRPHRPDEKLRNPIQGEFFSEEAVEKPAQALVREVIQNSLDARASDEPVEVRFAVSAPEALPEESARFWLEGAWAHLRAKESGLRGVPTAPRACRFLVVEDFGTTGLDGDPLELRPHGTPSRLFAFFRAEGISQKGGKDGGRWGVGKTVFLRSSELNTILCLTVRADDGRRLVFGQTTLRYHELEGSYFTPDGAFGAARQVDGGSVIVPSEDAAVAARLIRDFELARRDEPGLSVIVPFAAEELTGAAVLEAVMREYFYPILSGRLVVSVSDPSLGSGSKTLNADTLLDELVRAGPEVNQAVKSLAALAITFAQGFTPTVALEPPAPGLPRWSPAMFPEATLSGVLASYRRGDPILFRVPITVHPEDEPERESYFHVMLRRDLEERGAAPAFVRNGIQIPKALERRVRGQSLWALVVIEHQPIATLLGDAETPAHTHWSKDTQNFRNKYRYGAATIEFVRGAPRVIAETLAETAREKDFLSLVSFFPAAPSELGRAAPVRRPAAAAEDAGRAAPPALKPGAEAYRLERLEGGFRLSAGAGAPPSRFSVAVAYDCSRGNPLKRWDVRDFDLASLPRSARDLNVLTCSGNGLSAEHGLGGFRLEVTGFDPCRDLFVKVLPAEDGA